MESSFIYSNIYIYRFVMNMLYNLKYKRRFQDIIACIDIQKDSKIVDLCFGDIYIAYFCRKNNLQWIGYDSNATFVRFATSKGFNAIPKDISLIDAFPKVDVCIISGSFYHFHSEAGNLLKKMLESSTRVIISEPVVNISSQPRFIGKIARSLSNAGNGSENFRYSKKSILEMLDSYKSNLKFTYIIKSIKRDILIEIIHD